MKYILYDPSNNRSIYKILKYLDYRKYNLEPHTICNSIIDSDIINSPSIYVIDNNKWYTGETECVKFYSDFTLIMHLKDKAETFDRYSPSYPRRLHKIKVE